MPKKKPSPADPGPMLKVGTKCILVRPNFWAGKECVVEGNGSEAQHHPRVVGLHIVKVKGLLASFPAFARFEELQPLSETSESRTPSSSSPRPS